MRGIDRDRIGRARHADNAVARLPAKAARAAGRLRARVVAGTRQDERRAPRIFVARGIRARQRPAPGGRRIDESLRRDGGERGLRECQMSASRIAPARTCGRGSREWPGFSRKKVTLALGFDRETLNLAGFPVDSWRGTSTASTRAPCPF